MTLRKFRPHTADAAMDDLAAIISLAENEPLAAKALQDAFEIGPAVVVCHIDPDATKIAGKFVFHFELEERLKTCLATFRARQLEPANL